MTKDPEALRHWLRTAVIVVVAATLAAACSSSGSSHAAGEEDQSSSSEATVRLVSTTTVDEQVIEVEDVAEDESPSQPIPRVDLTTQGVVEEVRCVDGGRCR